MSEEQTQRSVRQPTFSCLETFGLLPESPSLSLSLSLSLLLSLELLSLLLLSAELKRHDTKSTDQRTRLRWKAGAGGSGEEMGTKSTQQVTRTWRRRPRR